MTSENSNELEHSEDDSAPNLIDYLSSEYGHEVAKSIVEIFHNYRKATDELAAEKARQDHELNLAQIKHQDKQQRLYLSFQVSLLALLVVAAFSLVWADKFTPVVGVFFGTTVGYLFGRRTA